jgi:hypothetical protein
MNKTVQLLKQIDEEEIAKAFAEAKKNADSPEAVSRIVDKIVKKTGVTNPAGQAYLSNFTNSMLLGEAAMDEIPELAIATPLDRAYQLKKASYDGMDELRDSIHSEVSGFPKLGNKIEISPEYNSKFWGRSDRSGILLHQPDYVPLNFRIGVNKHEYGHQFEDVIKLALAKLDHLKTVGLKDPRVAADYEKTKSALFNMYKKYPDIKKFIEDKSIIRFKNEKYNEMAPAYAQGIEGKTSPSDFEKAMTRGHMFKRNYEFDNLMNALKGGLKNVKSVGVGMVPAAAAAAIAAYSPDSMAGEAAKTSMKVMEEGDPLSMLIPANVNENEEAEVQKMIQEQKATQAPGSTDDKWYGRKWSKVKDLLGK